MRIQKISVMMALVAGMLAFGAPAAMAQQQTTRQATVGNLIAALNNISVEIGQLNALNNLTVGDVRLVNVDNVLNNNNVRAFNNALNRNNVEILNLRNVLNNNEIIKNVLNNAKINISRVVAIDVLSGGDVIVFFQ